MRVPHGEISLSEKRQDLSAIFPVQLEAVSEEQRKQQLNLHRADKAINPKNIKTATSRLWFPR